MNSWFPLHKWTPNHDVAEHGSNVLRNMAVEAAQGYKTCIRALEKTRQNKIKYLTMIHKHHSISDKRKFCYSVSEIADGLYWFKLKHTDLTIR